MVGGVRRDTLVGGAVVGGKYCVLVEVVVGVPLRATLGVRINFAGGAVR